MRVLVCGDRNWTDANKIRQALLELNPDTIIEGECRGADKISRLVAETMGMDVIPVKAEWDRYGNAAGPLRNIEMLSLKPDIVLAFHSHIETSKGTNDMITRAKRAGISVRLIT